MTWMRYVTLFISTLLVLSCATAPSGAPASNAGEMPAAAMVPSSTAMNAYLRATMLQREGRFEEALALLEGIIAEGEGSEALGERVVHNYLRVQEYQKARKTSERLLKRFPQNARLWMFLGLACDRLELPQDAAEAFRKAAELSPEDQLLQQALIEAQTRSNDLVAAAESYERLVEFNPDSASLRMQLGFTLMRIGDNDGAIEQLRRVTELSGEAVRARYFLALLYLDEGQNEAALREFEQLLDEAPAFPNVGPYVAAALARLEQYGRAISVMRAMLENGQGEPAAYLQTMYLHWKAGTPEKAQAFMPAEGAPIFGQLLRGLALKGAGEPYRSVLSSLDEVDGVLEQEVSAYVPEILYLEGADTEGGAWLDALQALREEGVSGKRFDVILARTYMMTNQNTQARPILEHVLAEHGDDSDIHYSLAVIAEEQDDIVAAERHLKAILDEDSSDHNTMNFLGYMYAEKGIKLDEAYDLLEKALELDPNNPFYLDSLGWVYYKQGDAKRAIELIRRAILGMESDDAVLRDHLGDAYARQGEWEKAIAQWERAQRLDAALGGLGEKIEDARRRQQSR